MQLPPIRLSPGFIADPDALFAALKSGVAWDERMKARKTASYGASYDYAQIAYDDVPMPAPLDALCARLEGELGFRPNNCLLNYYPDGASSMGFHSDETDGLADGTGVAIISLGSVRAIAYRSKLDKTLRVDYPLPNGSLLYMSGQVQQDWLHAIPKDPQAGERISLTFRAIRR
ncbi:alpha-ketoglutarate-dependent dioxygenase AlkB [Massilia violaceinigra]|uniref:Alpha-ketoglutarate-dependent dioxygenase AlkB n=1 Tax=Massilia violaceinigra TaxID=2045208 RepID=A0ABY4AB42_9BURK|nr:alpha-ketoglutarate-dependent dioxygenase AlkB [Massilia violaceinigra]UOD32029.1 alpha-ketoglutarate-dependent dioxygenase AlkB [Massilia violaceinigra]